MGTDVKLNIVFKITGIMEKMNYEFRIHAQEF